MSGMPIDDGRCSACNCTSRDLWPFKDKLASYHYQPQQVAVKVKFEGNQPGHKVNLGLEDGQGCCLEDTIVIDTKVDDGHGHGYGQMNGFIEDESRGVLNGLLDQVVVLAEGSSSNSMENVKNELDHANFGLSSDKEKARRLNKDSDQEVTILDALVQVYQIESKNWIDKEDGSLCTNCLGILCSAYKSFQDFLNVSKMGNSSIWKAMNNRSSRSRISSGSKVIKNKLTNDILMNGNKEEQEIPSPDYEPIEPIDFVNESSCDRDQTPTPDFIDFLEDEDNDIEGSKSPPISTLNLNNNGNDKNLLSLIERYKNTCSVDLFRVDNFEISDKGKIFCPICFHVYTDTNSLRNHIIIHKRLKTKCKTCFNQYATQKELDIHRKIAKGKCEPLRSAESLIGLKIDDAHYDLLVENLTKIPAKFTKRKTSTSSSTLTKVKKVLSPSPIKRPQRQLQKSPQRTPQRPQRIIPSSKPLLPKIEIKSKIPNIIRNTYKIAAVKTPLQNQRNVNVRKILPSRPGSVYCIDLTEDDLKSDDSTKLKPKLRLTVKPASAVGPASSKLISSTSSFNNKKTIINDHNERTEKRKRKPSKAILDDNFIHEDDEDEDFKVTESSSEDEEVSNSDEDSDSNVKPKVRRVGSSPFKLRERTKITRSFKEQQDEDSDSDYVKREDRNEMKKIVNKTPLQHQYPCIKCGKEFPTEYGVKRHERDVHLQRTCSNSKCNIEFKSMKELEVHRKTVHFPKSKPITKVVEIINKTVRDINSNSSDGDNSKESSSSAAAATLDEDFNFNINDPKTLSRIGGITLTHSEEVTNYTDTDGNSLSSIQVNNPTLNTNNVDADDSLDFLDELDILNQACAPYTKPQQQRPIPPLKIKLNENHNLKIGNSTTLQQKQQGKMPTAIGKKSCYVPKPKGKKLGDYICKYCDKDFARKKDLKLHESEEHFITSAPAKYRPGPKSSKLTTPAADADPVSNNSHSLSFLIPPQNSATTTTTTMNNQNNGNNNVNFSTIDLSELGLGFPSNHNCTEVIDHSEQVVEETIEVEYVDLEVPLAPYTEDNTLFPDGGIDDFNDLIQF